VPIYGLSIDWPRHTAFVMSEPDAFAQRRLRLIEHPEREVVLLIQRPRARETGEVGCRIDVVGLGFTHEVFGIDEIQALELAVRLLPAILQSLLAKHPGLRWDEAPAGDFGLRPAE
jgi:hypothetical protein